jgi:hypothetical protein
VRHESTALNSIQDRMITDRLGSFKFKKVLAAVGDEWKLKNVGEREACIAADSVTGLRGTPQNFRN